MDFESESLKIELRELAATPLQRAVLERDVPRARAAIAEAIKRGAGQPIQYALSLFNSERFQPEPAQRPKPVNRHARSDPTRTDEGERIWQADEVDEVWRHGYLGDCIQAYLEGRDPAARYLPSDEECVLWFAAMKERMPALRLDPSGIHWTAAHALGAWAEVWGFEDLLALVATDREPDVAPVGEEPALA